MPEILSLWTLSVDALVRTLGRDAVPAVRDGALGAAQRVLLASAGSGLPPEAWVGVARGALVPLLGDAAAEARRAKPRPGADRTARAAAMTLLRVMVALPEAAGSHPEFAAVWAECLGALSAAADDDMVATAGAGATAHGNARARGNAAAAPAQGGGGPTSAPASARPRPHEPSGRPPSALRESIVEGLKNLVLVLADAGTLQPGWADGAGQSLFELTFAFAEAVDEHLSPQLLRDIDESQREPRTQNNARERADDDATEGDGDDGERGPEAGGSAETTPGDGPRAKGEAAGQGGAVATLDAQPVSPSSAPSPVEPPALAADEAGGFAPVRVESETAEALRPVESAAAQAQALARSGALDGALEGPGGALGAIAAAGGDALRVDPTAPLAAAGGDSDAEDPAFVDAHSPDRERPPRSEDEGAPNPSSCRQS